MPDDIPPSPAEVDRVRMSAAEFIEEKAPAGLPLTPAAVQSSPAYPIWPVWIAPLVAGTYYLALRGAFAHSIGGVVFDASDVDLTDIAAPQWGSHWIYRIFAEAASLAFGMFVAAGVARQRARAAALVGAFTISAVYLVLNAAWVYFVYFANSHVTIEPWYQHLIEAAIVVGAPFIGAAVSEAAAELNGPTDVGFAGINRLHFLWLWVATGLYSLGIIAPLINLCQRRVNSDPLWAGSPI